MAFKAVQSHQVDHITQRREKRAKDSALKHLRGRIEEVLNSQYKYNHEGIGVHWTLP